VQLGRRIGDGAQKPDRIGGNKGTWCTSAKAASRGFNSKKHTNGQKVFKPRRAQRTAKKSTCERMRSPVEMARGARKKSQIPPREKTTEENPSSTQHDRGAGPEKQGRIKQNACVPKGAPWSTIVRKAQALTNGTEEDLRKAENDKLGPKKKRMQGGARP